MASGALVSIIMPVRNAEDTIRSAMKSILQQSYSNLEFIIINDNSSDASIDIAQSIRDQRIKIINATKPGIAESLNSGVLESKGEYIARMDADDESFPDRLQKQVNYLSENPDVSIVSGQVVYVGDEVKNRGYHLYVQWINQLKTNQQMFLKRFVDSPVAHPSILMRREIFDRFGLYKQGNFPEDYELWLRLFHHKVKFDKVDADVIKWYDHPDRLSRTDQKYSRNAFYELKAQYFSAWFKKNVDPDKKIYIWGTGKAVKEKSYWLKKNNIKITGYIDVTSRKIFQSKPVIHYTRLNSVYSPFILSFVSDRSGKQKIYQFLKTNGYKEGTDFYMIS